MDEVRVVCRCMLMATRFGLNGNAYSWDARRAFWFSRGCLCNVQIVFKVFQRH